MNFHLRNARQADVLLLQQLMSDASVRGLQAEDYTAVQIDLALKTVYGVDSQLIADGSYFVVETDAGEIVGCGGWSKRKTLYGGDQFGGREDSLLDPAAGCGENSGLLSVHPDYARHGIGGIILRACEDAAVAAGFRARRRWELP